MGDIGKKGKGWIRPPELVTTAKLIISPIPKNKLEERTFSIRLVLYT